MRRIKCFIIFYLIGLILFPFYLTSQADPLLQRCQEVSSKDIKLLRVRQEIIRLVQKIERQREKYLKPAAYSDIRSYYEKLRAKLGNYYFNNKDYLKALEHYSEAEKYSREVSYYKKRISHCQRFLNETKSAEPSPVNSQGGNKETIDFMDNMHRFVKSQYDFESSTSKVYLQLLKNQLNGPEFISISESNWKHIPRGYDALMNQFFHVIYVRRAGWKKRAEEVIKAGGWEPSIENKLREILDDLKRGGV